MKYSFSLHKRAFLLMAGTLLSTSALAQTQPVPSSVEPGTIERRNEKLAVPSSTRTPLIQTEDGQRIAADSKKVFALKGVEIQGNTVYSAEQLQPFYSQFVGKDVSFADLQEIAQVITAKYRGDGYILSRAVLGAQKIKSGIVHLQVIEGYISNVILEGEVRGDRSKLDSYAEKIKASRPLRSAVLERYLLLADDLPGVTARGNIRPSAAPGASDLVVALQHKMIEGAVGINNYGNSFTGPYQASGVIAANSLLGLYERNTLRAIATPDGQELRFADFLHEEQIGNEGTQASVRLSASSTDPQGRLEPLDIEGDSQLLELALSHPLIRSRQQNLLLKGSFRALNSETDLLNTLSNKDHVRHVELGVAYDFADEFGGVNLVDFSVTQGLDTLGATDDGAGRSRVNGEHDFRRANLKVTRVQDLMAHISLFGSVSGQASSDPLLASEEFLVGGRAIGRAYDGGEISGDQGVAGIAELRYAGYVNNGFLESYQAYAFYDLGKVWNKSPAVGEVDAESLASTGLGVRMNFVQSVYGEMVMLPWFSTTASRLPA